MAFEVSDAALNISSILCRLSAASITLRKMQTYCIPAALLTSGSTARAMDAAVWAK